MRFSLSLIAAVSAISAVSAQTNPAALLQAASLLLSPSCRSTVETVLAPNSTLFQCLQFQALAPILANNQSSVIPQVNGYLQALCSAPACSNDTITMATQAVLGNCSSDLSKIGIPAEYVQYAMNAIPTARKVACLTSSNQTLLAPAEALNATYNATSMMNGTSSMMNGTSMPMPAIVDGNMTMPTNGTSTPMPMMSNETAFCPIELLAYIQNVTGAELSNNYIDSLLLGANATAYNQLISLATNATIEQQFLCNDCLRASVDVVLQDYPMLANYTFSVASIPFLNNVTQAANMSSSFNVSSYYNAVCNATIGPNATLPTSVNETAFNTTIYGLANSTMSNATSSTVMSSMMSASSMPTPVPQVVSSVASEATSVVSTAVASSTAAAKRFVKWE